MATDYPINYHVLAEDFQEQAAGTKAYNQGDAEWLHKSLTTMCDAYDKLVGELAEARNDLNLSVCYAPGAIRDSYDSYDDDDENRVWAEQASDEQLLEVSEMIIGSDPTWSDFHNNIDMCVEAVRTRKE